MLFWSMDFEWIKDVICCTKQAGWMAKSKVVMNYQLEHMNKELDARLIFSSALILALLLRVRVLHRVAPSKRARPLLHLHYCSFHLMISL
jgi:hypothetical protein